MSGLLLLHDFFYYNFLVVCAMMICLLSMPSILHVAKERLLFDNLGHFRKQHDHGIPRLGGVSIFVSFTITLLLFSHADNSLPLNYLLTACIILFAVGLKDDLAGVNPSTKFIVQAIVAGILVFMGDIRLSSFYGILGINELPYSVSVLFSILLIIFLINSFNLIDGIDGLAGTTAILVNISFAFLFIYMNQPGLAVVALAITGAVLGFLKFNYTPARIFMGDTGSLLLGLISAVLAIKFIELNKIEGAEGAILVIPVFDTLRIFTIRIIKGYSPFQADDNHIHHRLIRLGFNHLQATFLLGAINIILIILALSISNYSNSVLMILFAALCAGLNWLLTFLLRSRERASWSFRNFIS
jgi:UDP-GlcNAc:undecaprenyl-phosphate GlcNAc-1-phosphate transferase